MDTTWLPAHPGCPDSLATNGVSDIGALSLVELVVRNGDTECGPVPSRSGFHCCCMTSWGVLLDPLMCSLPCPVPRTQGIFIAALPDGRRQKIRID